MTNLKVWAEDALAFLDSHIFHFIVLSKKRDLLAYKHLIIVVATFSKQLSSEYVQAAAEYWAILSKHRKFKRINLN